MIVRLSAANPSIQLPCKTCYVVGFGSAFGILKSRCCDRKLSTLLLLATSLTARRILVSMLLHQGEGRTRVVGIPAPDLLAAALRSTVKWLQLRTTWLCVVR